MAAPFMLVTFIDADGDEFPIRVEGMWTKGERPALIVEARRRLNEFVESGDLKPTEPLAGAKVVLT